MSMPVNALVVVTPRQIELDCTAAPRAAGRAAVHANQPDEIAMGDDMRMRRQFLYMSRSLQGRGRREMVKRITLVVTTPAIPRGYGDRIRFTACETIPPYHCPALRPIFGAVE
jgi:hypothetical protein